MDAKKQKEKENEYLYCISYVSDNSKEIGFIAVESISLIIAMTSIEEKDYVITNVYREEVGNDN